MRVKPFLKDITQICLVVKDFNKAALEAASRFGIGPFKCWEFKPPHLFNQTFREEKASWAMKLGIAWIGSKQLEIIEPTQGPSLYEEFLKNREGGVQHLLTSTGLSFAKSLKHMKDLGFKIGQSGMVNLPSQVGTVTLKSLPRFLAEKFGVKFVYWDTTKELKTVVEFSKFPPLVSPRMGLKIGKADYWIPKESFSLETRSPNCFIEEITKVGLVVNDLDAVIHKYTRLLGLGATNVYLSEPTHFSETKFLGQDIYFKVRLAIVQVGNTYLEIVQPLEGESLYHQLLRESGEGVHCLGIQTSLSFAEAREKINSLGCPTLMEGKIAGNCQFVQLDARPFLGVIFEINSVPPTEIVSCLKKAGSV